LGATQIIAYDNGNYSSDLVFRTSNPGAVNSSSERMRILANGNIGINKSSPIYNLDINGSLNSLTYYLNGIVLSNIGNLQFLDISSSLTSQLASKQPTLTSSSAILCSTINTYSLTNLSNLQYLDISSSLISQLASKQATITGTTNLSIGNLQLNTSSSSTPILQMYGYGGSGSSVSINLDTYYRSTPATSISAIDNGNSSSDLVFYTTTQGSQTSLKSERMRIYASGLINMTGQLNCNNLNFNSGSLYSDGNELWIYNNNLNYVNNYSIFSSNVGNTIINASSGQSINFKINNSTNAYMQIYPNGVVNIGSNQVYNKQLVLYDSNTSDSASSATVFYGFGINSNTLRYQVDTINSSHIFYGGNNNYATISYSGITSSGEIVSSNNIMFCANIYT
jgi:hypothetical protein